MRDNNSTNINKMSNILSPQIIEHKNYHDIMTLEIHVQTWDRQNNLVGLKWLVGSQTSHLDNWISNTYINKLLKKTCTVLFPLKETSYYTFVPQYYFSYVIRSSLSNCSWMIGLINECVSSLLVVIQLYHDYQTYHGSKVLTRTEQLNLCLWVGV